MPAVCFELCVSVFPDEQRSSVNESSSLLGGSPHRHCRRKSSPYHTGQLHPAVRVADLLQHINQMKTAEGYGFKQEYEVRKERDFYFYFQGKEVMLQHIMILCFQLCGNSFFFGRLNMTMPPCTKPGSIKKWFTLHRALQAVCVSSTYLAVKVASQNSIRWKKKIKKIKMETVLPRIMTTSVISASASK